MRRAARGGDDSGALGGLIGARVARPRFPGPTSSPTPGTISRAGTPAIRSIGTAAVIAQTAIIEATPRSMPPTITTTAMPAVAKAKSGAARARLSRPGAPKEGLDQLGDARKQRQQRGKPERPGVFARKDGHATPTSAVRP